MIKFTKWAIKPKKKRYLKKVYVKFHKDKKFDFMKNQKKIPVKIWIPWVLKLKKHSKTVEKSPWVNKI